MTRINYFLGLFVLFLGLVAVLVMASSILAVPSSAPLIRHPPQFRQIAHIEPASEASLQEKADNDWRLECPSQETECGEFGHLVWQDQAEKLLITLTMLQGQEKNLPRMRMIVPLGTFLPTGLVIRLENEHEISVPFQFCVPGGCFVNLDLAEDVIDRMKKAEKLEIYYKNADATETRVEVSLAGFSKGLQDLSTSTLASNKIE